MSEAAVEAAQALVERLGGEIRAAEHELVRLSEAKRPLALGAAKGDREASRKLFKLNEQIRAEELKAEDLNEDLVELASV